MKYSYTNSLALIESDCVFKRGLNAIKTGPFFFFFWLFGRGEGGGRSPPSTTSKPLILRPAKLNITMY